MIGGIGSLMANLKGRNHTENLSEDETGMLQFVFTKKRGIKVLPQHRDKSLCRVNTVMNR